MWLLFLFWVAVFGKWRVSTRGEHTPLSKSKKLNYVFRGSSCFAHEPSRDNLIDFVRLKHTFGALYTVRSFASVVP